METLKNKKGFTLIELLAVIVVLAIVTVIATQSILPYMANAGRDSFVSEANIALDGASDAMSLITLDSVTSGFKKVENKDANGVLTSTTYCFTLADLNAIGGWTKSDSDYAGQVVVTVPAAGQNYTYAVAMHNKDYYVNTTGGTIKKDDAKEYDSNNVPTGIKFDCSGVQ